MTARKIIDKYYDKIKALQDDINQNCINTALSDVLIDIWNLDCLGPKALAFRNEVVALVRDHIKRHK